MDVYNTQGKVVGKAELSLKALQGPLKTTLLHQAALSYLAARRRGTAKTKRRGEVSGSGIKPWAQKGTGRARAGSNNSPLWRRGGTVFGPKPRDYRQSFSKKAKRKALIQALQAKLQDKQMVILDKLTMERIKTKDMANILKNLKAGKKALLVLTNPQENTKKSSRNIAGFNLKTPLGLNAYDVLSHGKILITQDALRGLEQRLLLKNPEVEKIKKAN